MKTRLIAILMILAGISQANTMTGPEIINKVNELMNQESSKAVMQMTITTTSGDKRTFEYLTYSANKGEKNLMIYQKPQQIKGQKLLMLNNADDIWVFNARTKRSRKLATHAKRQKMDGSDFSYEDMGASNSFITDFDTHLEGTEEKDGQNCYKLIMTKKEGSGTSYAKMIMWVLVENFVPVVMEYYEKPDQLEKTLIQSDIKVFDGVPTGTRMEMINNNDHTNTIMQINEIEYNIKLKDELFTERGLKK